MRQLELDLNDRQKVRNTYTGWTGRLDYIRGNLAFIYFDEHGMKMSRVENVKPVEDLFIWPRYYGHPD